MLIISERKFPNGDAGGLRTLNLAKAFKASGQDVFVLACGRESNTEKFDEINFKNFGERCGYLDYFSKSIKIGGYIKKNKINDVNCHIYSTNLIFVFVLKLFFLKNISVSYDIVELFGKEKFKFYLVNPKWYAFNILKKYFYSNGKKNTYITKESRRELNDEEVGIYVPSIISEINKKFLNRKLGSPIKLLYMGNPQQKDDIKQMIVILLNEMNESKNNFAQFNITGLNYDELTKLIGNNYVEYYGSSIICHGWLNRDELDLLISESNFLYSIRFKGKSNKYNFPTKMVELFSYGIPIIGYNGDESGKYMIHGYNGLVSSDKEDESIRRIIYQLSRIQEEDYSKLVHGAVETAEKNFLFNKYELNVRE